VPKKKPTTKLLNPNFFMNISTLLHNRLAATYQKLAGRCTKQLEEGAFAELTARRQRRYLSRLLKLEAKLGIRSTARIKHWALAAAIGLVSLGSAQGQAQKQQPEQQLFKGKSALERKVLLRKHFSQARHNQWLRSNLSEISFSKGTEVGDAANGFYQFTDLDGDGDLDILDSGYYSEPRIFLNNGSGNYATIQDFLPSGGFYSNVIAGDIDGDGDQDLILNEYTSESYGSAIYLNNGSNNFSETIDINVEEGYVVGVADIDGDGDYEVAFGEYNYDGEYNSQNKIVFYNYTDNNWLEVAELAAVDNFWTIIVRDLNNDSKDDIIINNREESSAEVYISDGNSFSSAIKIDAGSRPYSLDRIAVANINRDEYPDLVLLTDTKLYTAISNSATSFSLNEIHSINSSDDYIDFSALGAGDLDGDGDDDIVFMPGVNNEAKFQVLINESGSFRAGYLSEKQGNYESYNQLFIKDYDGDEVYEIIFVNSHYNRFYEPSSDDNFALQESPLDIVVSSGERLALADTDSDGDMEVLSAGLPFIWVNNNGRFNPKTIGLNDNTLLQSIEGAQLDGDGNLDIVLEPYEGAKIFILKGNGDNTFKAPEELVYEQSEYDDARVYGSEIVDLDGNGTLDLFTGISLINDDDDTYERKTGDLAWYNDGSASFEPQQIIFDGEDPLGFISYSYVAIIDNFDKGDEQPEFLRLQIDEDFNRDIILSKLTGNKYQDVDTLVRNFEFLSYPQIKAADLDEDGDLDVVVIQTELGEQGYGFESILVSYLNDGNGIFTAGEATQLDERIFDYALADFDNDNIPELAVIDPFSGINIYALEEGAWSTEPIATFTSYFKDQITVEDIDGDGDNDIAVSSYYSSVEVWYNNLIANPNGLPTALEQNIRIFPNPSSDKLHISLPKNLAKENWQVSVYDTSGRLQVTEQASTLESVDIENLATGIYILKLSNGQDIFQHRFIKN
jgi:hypothetical protein